MKAVNLLVALFLCLCTLVQAQDYTASAQYYGPEIGLAHREVNAIFQDRQGFMWFGTKFSLNRFDGNHFTPYTQQAKGLDFDDIQSIAQDADGLLCVAHGAGEYVFHYPLQSPTSSGDTPLKIIAPEPQSGQRGENEYLHLPITGLTIC